MPLIVVEGTDGVGKTCQVTRLYLRLKQMGVQVDCTSEPYTIHEELVLSDYDAIGQLFLFQADRSVHCQHMRQWLKDGWVVLCDRYTASTLAYQGYGHGLDLGMIRWMNQISTKGLQADLTIWLDMSVEKALKRSKQDALDGYDVAFYERVRRGYGCIADRGTIRIDADRAAEEVEAEVWAIVSELLAARKPQTSADLVKP